jgi:hypothetical protein
MLLSTLEQIIKQAIEIKEIATQEKVDINISAYKTKTVRITVSSKELGNVYITLEPGDCSLYKENENAVV